MTPRPIPAYSPTMTYAVIETDEATATVYQSEAGTFYFCCKTCGNCGRHWLSAPTAVTDASDHVTKFDHKRYHNGS